MHNSTQIYVKQTSLFGETESISSLEVSPVNHSVWQENEKVPMMIATSGLKCLEQYERFVPAGSWARTFSGLLIGTMDWYSNRCALTWKVKGTQYNRIYFQLAVSAHPTKEKEYGLLPTVQTQGLKTCEKGKTVFYDVNLLPTPRTADVEGGTVKDVKMEKGNFYRTNSQGIRWGVKLRDVVESGLLKTPTVLDATPDAVLQTGKRSQLNHRFVMEMMGFPPDWTELPFLSCGKNLLKEEEIQ